MTMAMLAYMLTTHLLDVTLNLTVQLSKPRCSP